MKKLLYIFSVFFLFYSCVNNRTEKSRDNSVEEYTVEYAKGFSVEKYPGYTEVTINNPWDSTRILQRYILVDKDRDVPQNIPAGTLVRIPLTSVVAYSAIHCAVLNELGVADIIKAVCEPEYITVQQIKDGVAGGSVTDLGLGSNPDVEKLMLIDPEAIFASPIQGLSYGRVEKTGIPILEVPDYMESTPLGRAEWIRLYSLFVGKEALADSLFSATKQRYNEVKNAVSISNHPTVFTDLKYGNIWYTPGGESYISNLLKDAGAAYIWSDDDKCYETDGGDTAVYVKLTASGGGAPTPADYTLFYNPADGEFYKELDFQTKVTGLTGFTPTSGNTITLNNFTFATTAGDALSLPNDSITIELIGNNSITSNATGQARGIIFRTWAT